MLIVCLKIHFPTKTPVISGAFCVNFPYENRDDGRGAVILEFGARLPPSGRFPSFRA